MITKDKELKFAAESRQKIIDLIAGLENAPSDRFWDKSPNWLTKKRLAALLVEFENGLRSLGAIDVSAHAPCGDPHHEEKAKWELEGHAGYWRYVLDDGRADTDLLEGGELVVGGEVMDSAFDAILSGQASGRDACPCNPSKRAAEHSVARFFLWPHDSDSRLRELSALVLNLRCALDQADDRRPRSAIREELLYVLILLERLISPETASEHIDLRGVI